MAAEFSPCTAWVTDPETFSLCEPGDIRPDVLADAIDLANAYLYVRTGRAFPGACPDVWRPNGWGCGGGTCTCGGWPSLRLRSEPVLEVSEVWVDGAILPESGWRLGDPGGLDANFLYRVDGGTWPCCQDIAKPLTEPGTLQVSYTWGRPAPAGGARLVELLACEYTKAWAGDSKCRLPGRFQTITRENLTATKADPSVLLGLGMTGIAEVDDWIAMVNPGGVDRPPKVLDPEMMGLGSVGARPPHTHHRWP